LLLPPIGGGPSNSPPKKTSFKERRAPAIRLRVFVAMHKVFSIAGNSQEIGGFGPSFGLTGRFLWALFPRRCGGASLGKA
jgi:hypothetical protein